jgi:hypothetical protein
MLAMCATQTQAIRPTGLPVIFFIAKAYPYQPESVLAEGVTLPNNAAGSPTAAWFLFACRWKWAEE